MPRGPAAIGHLALTEPVDLVSSEPQLAVGGDHVRVACRAGAAPLASRSMLSTSSRPPSAGLYSTNYGSERQP